MVVSQNPLRKVARKTFLPYFLIVKIPFHFTLTLRGEFSLSWLIIQFNKFNKACNFFSISVPVAPTSIAI